MVNQQSRQLKDQFARPLQDLRVSVIDRCNFRCTYCMPEAEINAGSTFLKETQWMNFDEIEHLVRCFVELGTTKIRITGGEPLLRPKLPQLIARLSTLSGIQDLALTTNGALLGDMATDLKAAGLQRLTVSLDSLDEEILSQMSGKKGQVKRILEGIEESRKAGFEDIKINTVVQKGINQKSILDLVKFARESRLTLRFIEYMDVGTCHHWDEQKVFPAKDILQMIQDKYSLNAERPNYYGEVASRYTFEDGKGELGFITSVSQPFCSTCTRARLSTDGKLYTCLFAGKGTDLLTPLRQGNSAENLKNIISSVWEKRADKYSENRALFRSLKEQPAKVEMFQIGG